MAADDTISLLAYVISDPLIRQVLTDLLLLLLLIHQYLILGKARQ